MKRLQIILCGLLVGFNFSFPSEPISKSRNSPQKVAEAVLASFRATIDESVTHYLGFDAATDVKTSHLGKPIRLYDLSCELIKDIKNGSRNIDPRKMALDEAYFFPIQDSSNRNRSLILVKKAYSTNDSGKSKDWVSVQVGSPVFTMKMDSVIQLQPKASLTSLILIRSPVMGASFLGFQKNDGLYLQPIILPDSLKACMKIPQQDGYIRANR
jgi:hypothetical protein